MRLRTSNSHTIINRNKSESHQPTSAMRISAATISNDRRPCHNVFCTVRFTVISNKLYGTQQKVACQEFSKNRDLTSIHPHALQAANQSLSIKSPVCFCLEYLVSMIIES